MTRLFGVMIQLDNGRFIAIVIASFRRNLWTHFYDSGQYTEIETRARLLHCKSEVYCYCGIKKKFYATSDRDLTIVWDFVFALLFLILVYFIFKSNNLFRICRLSANGILTQICLVDSSIIRHY